MTALNLNKVNFTNFNDELVNPGTEIFNPLFSSVDTLKGDDKIIGSDNLTGEFGVYVEIAAKNSNSIASADLSSKASVDIYGIQNRGTINTNDGSDTVQGTAKAVITATAQTVSAAIAIAKKTDATTITKAFASIKIKASADGIDNSWGVINTDKGNDTVNGNAEASISAIALATAVAIAEAPMSEGLTAFAGAMATSIAKARITATGIENTGGKITTGEGNDTISASAKSSAATLASSVGSTLASATPGNQALAEAVVNASAKATDKAIAIDNTLGFIDTGDGKDQIIAQASGSESYGIFGGTINMGKGDDSLIASSFGGGVNMDMGEGDDWVKGFGNAIVNGGKGLDILDLGSYNKDDFKMISFGANNNNSVIFKLDDTIMITTGFEKFNFANDQISYTYDKLKTA